MAFALVLLLAGFLLVVQVRADRALRLAAALPSRRLGDLTALVRRQQETDRMLRDEVASLQAKLDDYRTAEMRGQSLALDMRRELSDLRVDLGLTPVHGPGLVVVLAVGPTRLTVPQAEDVSGIVNELWAAGAEAVAVNGIRIMATSGVSGPSGAIRVAGRATPGPYSIVAIGDPAGLEDALSVRGGIVDGLRGVGLTVLLSRISDVRLPAYTGRLRFRLARPVGAP
jgi:uncharacterized protein YlxW (UPF0749 family)